MAWQFRKSKTFGPLRLTLSKTGVSASVGAGPLRFSANSRGQVRRTVRVPGTGLYNTEVIGNLKGAPVSRQPQAPRRVPAPPPQPPQPGNLWHDDFLDALLNYGIAFTDGRETCGLGMRVGEMARQGFGGSALTDMVSAARPDLTREQAALVMSFALRVYAPQEFDRIAAEWGVS